MAAGFSVKDALNKNSKAGIDESPRARFRTKDISIFKMYRNDMNFYSVEQIEELAGDILMYGLKQNLELVYAPCDKGEYRIVAGDKAPEVAVGWRERKLNGKYDFKWLYAGKFAEGISEEASTKEGKLSPTTKSIKGSFYERSLDNAYEISVDESNLVKENTKAAEAIKSWFSKVQEKNDAAA